MMVCLVAGSVMMYVRVEVALWNRPWTSGEKDMVDNIMMFRLIIEGFETRDLNDCLK